MFARLFGRTPRLPTLDTDRARDDFDLRAARDKANGGDWTAPQALLDATGTNWELRGRRLRILAEAAADNSAWLDNWLAARPEDPTATTIHASVMNELAGQARGAASAANTTREQFIGFAELSAQATRLARKAIDLAPLDPVPCDILLGSMFAGGRTRTDEFADVYSEGIRRDPHNFDLHTAAVSFYCEKWYGSHEQMFETARRAAKAAPPGASVTVAPLFAHFEYAMREYLWDKRTPEALAEAQAYFRGPEVQRELDACAAKWGAGGPAQPEALTCRNWLALGYSLANRRPEAKAMFDEIGPYVSSYTWGYFYRSRDQGYLGRWLWANGRVK